MKRYALIEVTWLDSDHGSGWHLLSDMGKKDPPAMLCKSIGYFLEEFPDTIRIVQSHTQVGTHEEQINGILTIPKVAVKRKRVIK